MGWTGVITDAGRALFASYIQGGSSFSVDTVKAGSDAWADNQMNGATALKSLKDSGVGHTTGSQTTVEAVDVLTNGVQFRMRVAAAPTGVNSYPLTEMGLFINSNSGGQGTSVMVAYFKTDQPTDVPEMASFPDFAYVLSSILEIDTSIPISITVDSTAYVSRTSYEETISGIENSIAEKVSINQGADKNGRFMGVASDGNVYPIDVSMKGATASTAGKSGFVPRPLAGQQTLFLRGDGTWASATYDVVSKSAAGLCPTLPNETATSKYLRQDGTWVAPPNTTYSAGTGLALNSNTFSLNTTGVTAGSYGMSAATTGNNDTQVDIPYITVDSNGRITSISNKKLTCKNTTYGEASTSAFGVTKLSTSTSSTSTSLAATPSAVKAAYDLANGKVSCTTANVKSALGTGSGTTKYLREDGTWVVPPNTTYSAGTGLSLSSGTFSLGTSGATAGSYGMSAATTGSNNVAVNIPYITVDAYGRVTSISNKALTCKDTTYGEASTSAWGVTKLSSSTSSTSTSLAATPSAVKAAYDLANGKVSCTTANVKSALGTGSGTSKFLREDGTWQIPAYSFTELGSVTNLNLSSLTAGKCYHFTYVSATNAPSTASGHGYMFTNPDSSAYGRMVAYADRDIYTRAYTAGAWGAWSSVPCNAANVKTALGTGSGTSKYLREDGTWATPPNTTYSSATTSSAGLVDTSTQSFAGVKTFANTTESSSTTSGAVKISGGLGVAKNIYGAKVFNAVWNDYAECREAETIEAGRCVTECEDGVMRKTTERLMPGCRLTSDTYGSCMGETDKAKTPIAVAGRVLVYPFQGKKFNLGDAVCSAPDGTVDVMTREEIREYPERIVGTVSEIPKYEEWIAGTKENPQPIKVNGRIWVYVR